jgi:DNA polymerase elongation subunit (family B)
MLIEEKMRYYDVLKQFKCPQLKTDHIDIIEVAPGSASLKIYGGRLGCKRMQDLPFQPGTVLSPHQRAIVRWYCVNDLTTTLNLFRRLHKELDLRVEMGIKYEQDLRSKSDAQIAETVIGSEIYKISGCQPHKPKIEPGTRYKYKMPNFMRFKTSNMQEIASMIANLDFVISEKGSVLTPPELSDLKVNIGNSVYRMGIGGLHSSESCAAHHADEQTVLKDVDVTSYYPYIILNLGIFPHHLGPSFLDVFREIVETRVAAKAAKNKVVADSLKIVINGTFGKLGSKYSILYSPDLLIQVTLTGQLSLLLLIEAIELAGIPVVSANTDGIVIKCPKDRESELDVIVADWETTTKFNTEETRYKSLYSRDVNNYMAITHPDSWWDDASVDDKIKTKGAFAKTGLMKSPSNEICIEAVKRFLLDGDDIEWVIQNETDIRKFLTIRNVTGGGVKVYHRDEPGVYLGKAVRWYTGKGTKGHIVYAKSGKRVGSTAKSVPLMDIPKEFPNDVDYGFYIKESYDILKEIGHS